MNLAEDGAQEEGSGGFDRASIRRPILGLELETAFARYRRQNFRPHAHEEYLFGVIEAGVHSVWRRGVRHEAGAGFVVAMAPGEVHHGGAGGPEGWTQRMIRLDAGLLRRGLGAERGAAPLSFRESFHHRPDLARRLIAAHEALHGEGFALRRDAALDAILRIFADLADSAPAAPVAGAEDRRVAAMLEHLRAHVCEDVSLEDLCAVSGLGRRRTLDLFKSRTGLPPHAWHLQLKIRRVQELLRAGLPAALAAQEAGFADQSHMIRHFVALVGATPAVWTRG